MFLMTYADDTKAPEYNVCIIGKSLPHRHNVALKISGKPG